VPETGGVAFSLASVKSGIIGLAEGGATRIRSGVVAEFKERLIRPAWDRERPGAFGCSWPAEQSAMLYSTSSRNRLLAMPVKLENPNSETLSDKDCIAVEYRALEARTNCPRFRALLLLSFLMRVGLLRKEIAKGFASSSEETKSLRANAHQLNVTSRTLFVHSRLCRSEVM
jgi:hypothetical protein